MSHHFDSIQAKEDPRLNIADMYVFAGSGDSTVFVMTANVDTGLSSPDTLHEEGIYSFRIRLDNSPKDSLAFKFRFDPPRHTGDDEHTHVQPYKLIHSRHGELDALQGTVLLEGETGKVTELDDVQVFVGTVPDLWAADALSFRLFMSSTWEHDRFDPSIWEHKQNFFERRNIFAIVLEVPNSLLPAKEIHVWANITLFGHAAEVQVTRYGFPLFTHLFLANPVDDQVETYHQLSPGDDLLAFGPTIKRLVERVVSFAKTADDPSSYADQVVARLCPSVMPYEIGTAAEFSVERFNGRPLDADAFDVMFSLAANTPVADGVSPDKGRTLPTFPYYGKPYSTEEQSDLLPIPHGVPGTKAY